MGKLTLFADWQSKVEPNEDATGFGNQQTAAAANFTPYTRPFLYPEPGGASPISTQSGAARHAAGGAGQQLLQLSSAPPSARTC